MSGMPEFVDIQCPSCGEWIGIVVDASVERQQYTEDCQVCCRPIVLSAAIDDDGVLQVTARSEDET
jgi:hypothetical protein